MVGHLSLKRDSHSSDLVSSLRDLWESNSLVDCMLSSDGQYLKAHKVILSACSPYFQLLFKDETDKYPIVLLKDIGFEYLKLIVDFVYCGEVQVFETQLNTFLEIAKYLQIKGLNTSKESIPERSFSELPEESILANEFTGMKANNNVVDDGCKIINVPVDTTSVLHSARDQPCIDSVESNLMITDEATFSLAPQATPASTSHSVITTVDQEWHTRPASPVSVTSITLVKTEQLIDCEETSSHRTVSESENCMEEFSGTTESTFSLAPRAKPTSTSHTVITTVDQEWHTRPASPVSVTSITSVKTEQLIDCEETSSHKTGGECPFKCSECGAGFARIGSLWFHGRSQHPPTHRDERPFKCYACRASFTQRHDLMEHKRTHMGEHPFRCSVCGADFANHSTLKFHERSHTGGLLFKCGVCDASFARRRSLRMHTRTHTGERPFRCSVCGACFASSGDLKIHTREHTGERPYRCHVCGEDFKNSRYLRKHIRKHAGEGRREST